MQSAIAAPAAKGLQPRPDSNRSAALYFIGYIVCVVFVLLNLYVGVSSSCVQHTPEHAVVDASVSNLKFLLMISTLSPYRCHLLPVSEDQIN
jgi:DMSO/TMAO reductase YedYZ heme-binding membrane subunit